jgi:N-acetylglucosaminyldiphosphoundecaprenol N-acetyl-beta-D-mannosaminyltransferase
MSRANLLGVGIDAVSMAGAVDLIDAALTRHQKGYVCVTGVHGVMEAQNDSSMRAIVNGSFLTVPDGKPTVWVGRLQGHSNMGHVPGPQLMLRICELSVQRGYTHFLYGGADGVAESLARTLARLFPGIAIVGTYTPPFRTLNRLEETELIETVGRLNPDITWVGLSTPKQEKFMAEYLPKLRTTMMLGVGAAFDIHTKRIRDAPDWMKTLGLAWINRLAQEPRRLWKRYAIIVPGFLCAITAQLLGLKRYSLRPDLP